MVREAPLFRRGRPEPGRPLRGKRVFYLRLRVNARAPAGRYGEVRSLLSRGLDESCTAMQAIGYKEAAAAIRGEISEAEAVELIKRGTRRYAKRQLTYLRAKPEVHWIRWDAEPDFAGARRDSTIFLAGRGIR